MRFARFVHAGGVSFGVVEGDGSSGLTKVYVIDGGMRLPFGMTLDGTQKELTIP